MNRFLVSLFLALPASIAFAQGADVGLVNAVSGDVTYTAFSGGRSRVQAFMKVRDGDRINVAEGGQVRLVFFEGARQEKWVGPSSFRAARTAAEPISGKATEIVTLPAGTGQRLANVPQLVQIAKLGGIQVRGMTRAQKASVDQQSTISEARVTYEKLRKDMPADDITPELYLYAVLHEYLLYDELRAVVDEMLRKQPDSEQANTLANWVRSRTAR